MALFNRILAAWEAGEFLGSKPELIEDKITFYVIDKDCNEVLVEIPL